MSWRSVTSLRRYVRRPQARLACAFYILFAWLSPNMSHVVVIVARRPRILIPFYCFASLRQSGNRDLNCCRDNRRSLKRSLAMHSTRVTYMLHATTRRRMYCVISYQDCIDDEYVIHAATDHIGMTLFVGRSVDD